MTPQPDILTPLPARRVDVELPILTRRARVEVLVRVGAMVFDSSVWLSPGKCPAGEMRHTLDWPANWKIHAHGRRLTIDPGQAINSSCD